MASRSRPVENVAADPGSIAHHPVADPPPKPLPPSPSPQMRYHGLFMKLTFYGAAGAVTGSIHMVETGGRRGIDQSTG